MQKDILKSLNENDKHDFGVMVKNGRLKHGNATAFGVTDKAKSYMMLMTAIEDLDFAIRQWKSLPTWNPLAQAVVVVLYPIKSDYEKNIIVKTALEMLFEVGLIYANVVFHMNKTEHILETETWCDRFYEELYEITFFSLFIRFPYDGKKCADKVEDILKIDECIITQKEDEENSTTLYRSYRSFNEDKFPKLPFTFHKCPLKASTFIWEPFVVAKENERIDSGLEITMINTITEQMNLEISYKVLEKRLGTQEISSDNQTGIYADLIQK